MQAVLRASMSRRYLGELDAGLDSRAKLWCSNGANREVSLHDCMLRMNGCWVINDVVRILLNSAFKI